jgi:hypothetical protein
MAWVGLEISGLMARRRSSRVLVGLKGSHGGGPVSRGNITAFVRKF